MKTGQQHPEEFAHNPSRMMQDMYNKDKMTAASNIAISLALLIAFSLLSCQKPDQPFVATVNGEKIPLSEYEIRYKKHWDIIAAGRTSSSAEIEKLKEEILNGMITEKLMIQRAGELSITVNDNELTKKIDEIRKDYGNGDFNGNFPTGIKFDQWKEELKKRMLMEKLIEKDAYAGIKVLDKEVLDYYRKNIKAFTSTPRVHVAQILTRDEDKAEKIWNRLNMGEDFAAVAREESMTPEASKGGDLGFLPRGVMPEEIDAVIFSIPIGQISRVVKSPYGFHIFKVMKKYMGGQKPFAAAREDILSRLKSQKEEQAYSVWLQGLRKRARIQINMDAIKESELIKRLQENKQ